MRIDKNKYNLAVKTFLHDINFSSKKTFNAKIVLSKFLSENALILTDDGILTRIHNEIESKVELIKILKTNFNIAAELGVYNIVDFAEISADEIVIATEDFGIYKLKFTTNELILVTLHTGIRKVVVDKTGALFVAAREYCARYDLDNGKRIEKYGNLAKYFQIPREIINSSKGILVLGDSCGVSNVDNLVHFWKLDKEALGYNLYDNHIPKNPIDNKYQILYTVKKNDSIYLAGRYDKNIFVWQYDLTDDTYRMTECFIDCLGDMLKTFDGFIALDEQRYLILSKDRVYLVKNNELIQSLKAPEECKGIYLHKNELLSIVNDSLVKLELPVFDARAEMLSYTIYDAEESCNNIDIFVKGAGRAERMAVIDADTNREIMPSFYAVFNGNSIIKLMNCTSKKIKLIISVSTTSRLGGIVVKNNKMFLR